MQQMQQRTKKQKGICEHECPCNSHLLKNCDLDIWPWQMDFTFVQQKGLTKGNTHVKYESCITYHSKLMANVKVFSEKCDLDIWSWPWKMTFSDKSYDKECTCEILKLYHLPFRSYGQVFYGQTEGAKTILTHLSMWGHENTYIILNIGRLEEITQP